MNPELDQKLVDNSQSVPMYQLTVNVNELNVIFASLQELPYRVSNQLIAKLMQQAQQQH